MAFNEAQKNSICIILGIEKPILNAYLTSLGDDFTSDIETSVLAEVTKWSTAGENYADFYPKESNEGFSLKANKAKNAIRQNIALLLQISEFSSGSYGSIQIG